MKTVCLSSVVRWCWCVSRCFETEVCPESVRMFCAVQWKHLSFYPCSVLSSEDAFLFTHVLCCPVKTPFFLPFCVFRSTLYQHVLLLALCALLTRVILKGLTLRLKFVSDVCVCMFYVCFYDWFRRLTWQRVDICVRRGGDPVWLTGH